MTNAFDKRPFSIDDFMQTYWVDTGDLQRISARSATKQLERNYNITGPNAQPHVEDLVTELYIIVHETLQETPEKFPTMLDAKKYAVTLVKTRVANLVVPMMEQATIPKSNKSIARALGKKITGNEVAKDKDGNWIDSDVFKLDPTNQPSFVGDTRKPIMEQIDWNKYDTDDGDGWYYPDIDRKDLEYFFRKDIPLSLTDSEEEYLFDAMSYTEGLHDSIGDEPVKPTNQELKDDLLYEQQLYAMATTPDLIGHNGGPAMDDDGNKLEELVAERVGPLMQALTPLEQQALVEVAKYTMLDQSNTENSNWVWYQAGEALGKSKEHMRKIKEKIAAKARKHGLGSWS